MTTKAFLGRKRSTDRSTSLHFNFTTLTTTHELQGVAAFNPFCAKILVKSAKSSICSSVLKAVTIVASTDPTVTCVWRTSDAYHLYHCHS